MTDEKLLNLLQQILGEMERDLRDAYYLQGAFDRLIVAQRIQQQDARIETACETLMSFEHWIMSRHSSMSREELVNECNRRIAQAKAFAAPSEAARYTKPGTAPTAGPCFSCGHSFAAHIRMGGGACRGYVAYHAADAAPSEPSEPEPVRPENTGGPEWCNATHDGGQIERWPLCVRPAGHVRPHRSRAGDEWVDAPPTPEPDVIEMLRVIVARIDREIQHRGMVWAPDYACGQCVGESGEILRPGFRCALHRARSLLAQPPQPAALPAPWRPMSEIRQDGDLYYVADEDDTVRMLFGRDIFSLGGKPVAWAVRDPRASWPVHPWVRRPQEQAAQEVRTCNECERPLFHVGPDYWTCGRADCPATHRTFTAAPEVSDG